MKKFLSIILAGMMAISMAACSSPAKNNAGDSAAKESDLDYIKGNGKMIIGMTLFAPMNYEEDGELVGFETEFAKAVCEKLGVEAQFQEINWDSKEVELNAKNIDCIWNGMTITDERKSTMSITNPYMENKQVMIVKKENAAKYAESVADANIVAEAGSAGEELGTSDEFFKDGKFTAVDSQAKALMDVAAGTSDIAIVDYVMSIGSIGEGTDYADLVVVEGKSFSPEQYGIAFRQGSDVTEAVNAAIAELIAEGKVDEIAKKYKLDALIVK